MVNQIESSAVLTIHFHLVIRTNIIIHPKPVLNINHQNYFLINQLIQKVQTLFQALITSHLKIFLLNPQLYMNVLLRILLNKIVILTVHQFRMTPLMIILAIPHMKHMQNKLTMSEKIIQERWGRIFENISQ